MGNTWVPVVDGQSGIAVIVFVSWVNNNSSCHISLGSLGLNAGTGTQFLVVLGNQNKEIYCNPFCMFAELSFASRSTRLTNYGLTVWILTNSTSASYIQGCWSWPWDNRTRYHRVLQENGLPWCRTKYQIVCCISLQTTSAENHCRTGQSQRVTLHR